MSPKLPLSSLLVPVIGLALVIPTSGFGQGFGSGRDKDGKKEKKDDKPSRYGSARDGGEVEEGKDGDKPSRYGIARKESTSKRTSARRSRRKSNDKKERPSAEEIAKAKITKVIKNRLGRKKDGYFVFGTSERRHEKLPVPEGVAPDRVGYGPVEAYEAMVLKGSEKTLDFLVDYLSEYPPLSRKELRARARSKTPQGPPDPVRNWRFIKWFPDTPEGNRIAHRIQADYQANYDKQMAAAKRKRVARSNR